MRTRYSPAYSQESVLRIREKVILPCAAKERFYSERGFQYYLVSVGKIYHVDLEHRYFHGTRSLYI